MSVLKYYQKNKFNPVPIEFSGIKNIANHYAKRQNLLENHLKIFLPFLKNKNILEFGCNGAENACLLAEYGANLYLVEPHKAIHKIIIDNFSKIRKKKKIKLLSNKELENFSSKKKFDIIIAEGFLNTLNKRNLYFKKISDYLTEGGLLILNYDDVYGGFFEYLKSYILIKSCFKLKINPDSEEGYKLAKKLFKKEFDKLNKSRSFRSWWKDQLINPYAAKTCSFDDLLKLANSKKLICYSTSPAFNDTNLHEWYKNINLKSFNYKDINQKYYKIWKKNFLNFFIGKKIKNNYEIDKKTLISLKKFTNKMNLCLINKNLSQNLEVNNEIKTLFKKNNLGEYIFEIDGLIKLLNSKKKNIDSVVNLYLKSKKVKTTWGNLLHYVVFKKDFKINR